MLNLIRNTVSNFRTTQATQDSNNFLAAAGITGQVQSQAIYNLVNDLQISGLWSKMKAVYPMVTDNYNLLSYTEDFSNAAWVTDGLTVSSNSAISPDGTQNADKLVSNNASGNKFIYQIGTVSIGASYTASAYFKSSEYTYAFFRLGGVTGNPYVIYNLTNQSLVSTSGSVTHSIQSIGNGWYRIILTVTTTSTVVAPVFSFLPTTGYTIDGSNLPQYTGNGVDGGFIWGAQLESGNQLSAYQPIITTQSAFMASQMKYNLKDARDLDAAFRLTWSGGWTYSSTGATPNGTNAYADTKLNDNLLTPNSSHLSFYSRTNTFQTAYDIGLFNGTNGIWLGVGYSDGIRTGVFQTGASGELNQVTANTLGFVVTTKNGSTTVTAYKNGASVASGVKPDTSATNTTVYLGALNQNGSPGYGFSVKQIAFATIGDGLSSAEVALLNQLVTEYQTTLSRNV
jgi:hypothetical protein